MGVEYRRYLLPRPNDFLPSPNQFRALIESLREHHWICTPGSPHFARMIFQGSQWHELAQHTGGFSRTPKGYAELPVPTTDQLLRELLVDDVILCWPVDNFAESQLCDPFIDRQSDYDEIYYDIELHASPDYVYRVSEQIEPFSDDVACSNCGKSLVSHSESLTESGCSIFYCGRLFSSCRHCGRKVDVSSLTATLKNGWDSKKRQMPGGATSRFALVVDCGKCLPAHRDDIPLQTDLVELFQDVLGVRSYQIETYY